MAEIGFGAVTREDSAFMVGSGTLCRHSIEAVHRLPIVEGDVMNGTGRSLTPAMSIWPYDPSSLKSADRSWEPCSAMAKPDGAVQAVIAYGKYNN